MEALQTLGTALGLTMLAGINLYLTVFVTGLAIRMGWLELAPAMTGLEVLADPIILTVAGVLLVLEFIIDKCPYADNCWDTIHTILRPVGGAFLALKALGTTDPVMEIVAALLGGSVAFTAHSAKAGSRLMVNTSPEPVSNIVVSIGEDMFVLGGLWFVFKHPILSLFLVIAFVAAFWYFAPKFFRMARACLVGILHRFSCRRRAVAADAELPKRIPGTAQESWLTLQKGDEQVAWAVPCFSGRIKPVGRNVRGCLLATTGRRLFFIGRKNFRARVVEIPVENSRALDDPGAVFHRLTVKSSQGEQFGVRFTRKFSPFVPRIMDWIRQPAEPAAQPEAARTSAATRL